MTSRGDWRWIAGLSALSLLLNVSIAAVIGLPRPMAHDEFSYLLAADTFAQGRLTNPPHLLWRHFESMHVLQQPTYQSKYPPGQGMALAAGQLLTGLPIVGAWLASAAACGAVAWMLRFALPLPWALFGGVLALFHPLVLNWSRSYWGGSVAMLGGALLFGGLEWVIRRQRANGGLIMGLGMAVLALTRPYEGLLLSILALTRLLLWLFRLGPGRVALTVPVGGFLIVALAPAAAWLAYYDFRVTGDALKLPYFAYNEQYEIAPPFVWQNRRAEPEYRHEEMRRFHARGPASDRGHDGVGDILQRSGGTLGALGWRYTVLGVLAPLLAGLAWAWREDRSLRASAAILLAFVGGLLATRWAFAHYAAPGFGLFLLLLAAGARGLWGWRPRGRPVGRVIVVMALVLELAAWAAVVGREAWRRPRMWTAERARIVAEVGTRSAKSLIIVQYGPLHSVHQEWVYNRADVDRSAIVWARAMGPANDQAIVDYFRDRRVWRLDVNGADVTLREEPRRRGRSSSSEREKGVDHRGPDPPGERR